MKNQIIFKNMRRAIRRHHYRRLKNKRKHYWPTLDNMPLTDAALGICTNTPATCSGICCGNPRRHFGEVTIQEKKANQLI